MKIEQAERSETSAYKSQTPGNYPEESIQQIYSTFHIFWTAIIQKQHKRWRFCTCIIQWEESSTNTRLFEMTVRVLTTCHTQYTWDTSICIFLFNRTTLQVFVTYLIGALYVHPLWFYKHQHNNRVHSKLSVACQRWWFQWRFWFVPSVLGYLQEEEEHKPDPWLNPIERNHMGLHLENEVARRVASDHHRFGTNSIIVLMFAESQRVHI